MSRRDVCGASHPPILLPSPVSLSVSAIELGQYCSVIRGRHSKSVSQWSPDDVECPHELRKQIAEVIINSAAETTHGLLTMLI